MFREFLDFWGAERYSQHAICLTNDPLMIWLYAIADMIIFGSYLAISLVLIRSRRLGILPEPVDFTLFASFILACGLSHLTKTLTLFAGVYRLDILVVVATASVSLFTALFIFRNANEHV